MYKPPKTHPCFPFFPFIYHSITTEGVIEKVKALFEGHDDLILGFNSFLPKGYEIKLPERPQIEFDQAISYVNKIKQRFASDERVYKAFLEILNMYRKGQKTIAQVYDEVALLFRHHDDLLREFTYFLPDSSNQATAARRATYQKARPVYGGGGGGGRGVGGGGGGRKPPPALRRDDPKVQRELGFLDKVRARLRSKDGYADFLKCLNLYAEDVITKGDLVTLVQDIMGRHTDLMAAFNEFLMRCEVGPEDPYSRQYTGRDRSRSAVEKYIRMSISELDVAAWERATPSYVRLPDNYPKLKTSGRPDWVQALINDEWVSVTSGSEDYSFKHYRKNQYEEALFRAEDDHFELDMFIDQNDSAIKTIAPLVEEVNALPDDEARAAWRLAPGTLRAFHYRAAQRIYGDHGSQIVRLLKQNPVVTLPRLLMRMQQKQAEWKAVLAEMMPVWQGIYKDNYNKSLDHRSFYWKQTEKKNLTPKNLVQEIKDVADRRRLDASSVLQAVSSKLDFKARLAAQLTYDMTAVEVHNTAAYIIQLGIDNQLSIEATPKVRILFHSFFEYFFQLACSCITAEERRKAATETPRQASRRKHAGEEELEPSTGMDDDDDESDKLNNNKSNKREGSIPNLDGKPPAETNTVEQSSDEEDANGEATKFSLEPEEDETMYMACRPLVANVLGLTTSSSADDVSMLGVGPQMVEPGKPLIPHCRVVYANESLYVLMRLYQILYDRLKSARVCAVQKAAEARGGGATAPSAAEGSSLEWSESAEGIHNQFLELATDLIEGRSDPGDYEDSTRQCLGTAAYQLFTLDKLVNRIVKQMQAVLTEESSSRLVDLWKYENSRTVRVNDPVHYANARVVLGDDPCFRIEHLGDRRLTMQLMEPEKADNATSILEPAFRQYIQEYISCVDGNSEGNGKDPASKNATAVSFVTMSAAGTGGVAVGVGGGGGANTTGSEREDANVAKVCLLRNLPQGIAFSDASIKALDKTELMNGLECKLGWAGQKPKKIAYILGTEDFFHRPGGSCSSGGGGKGGSQKKGFSNNSSSVEKRRVDKFNQWLIKQEQAAAAAEAAEAAAAEAAEDAAQDQENVTTPAAAAATAAEPATA